MEVEKTTADGAWKGLETDTARNELCAFTSTQQGTSGLYVAGQAGERQTFVSLLVSSCPQCNSGPSPSSQKRSIKTECNMRLSGVASVLETIQERSCFPIELDVE